MVSYCYTWTPLVIVGTLSLLALPWLGLIALLVVVLGSLVLLAALVTAIVWVPLNAGRAILRRWHARIGTRGRPDATVPWARSGRQPTGSIPVSVTALLSDPRSRRDPA